MLGTTLANRYRLDQELGRGGMGVVYRAHDTLLDRPVAVKILSSPGLETEWRDRLLREAQAAAKLNHSNVVLVYDAGETRPNGAEKAVPFIVMELVEGQALRHLPAPDLAETLRLARQISAALSHAHSQGIVHRDLKPENVVVTPSQTVKLMDFGLARIADAPRLTAEGTIMGTYSYLAPELIQGQPASPQSDLYAFGVMLYEMTAHRPPFDGENLMAVLSQHLYAPVVPPSTYNVEIPPVLDALVVRLLSKQPEERPKSAAEVQNILEQLVENQWTATGMLRMDANLLQAQEATPLLGRIARGRLVGRQSEINQLRDLWLRSQQGNAHLILVSGEPGIGKTRLARELIAYAQLRGAVVLEGGCYEYEAATPYLPFVEALRKWVSGQSTEGLRRLLGSTAAELARLVPEIAARLGPLPENSPLPPNEERLRLFDNLARFLQTLAAERGLLFFLDDLHWADQGTLSLLHYLLRRLRQERLLILSAYREIELGRVHPLAASLVEWNRERLATRQPLGRLSADDTGILLATLFGEDTISVEFTDAIYRETEGNPFFVEEVVKSLVEQGGIYRVDSRWERKAIDELAIPQSVKEAIGRRLDRLSHSCLDALHTAAALGKLFSFSELAAVATLNEDQLLDALEEAGAAQLIRAERGETFIFTHDKIREVLYEELISIRRRRLHQRIGEGLEKLYQAGKSGLLDEHAQDLAHHFSHSGDLPKTLDYSLRAAYRARAIGAWDEALGYYQRALECAESLELPEKLAEIYRYIGRIYSLRGPIPRAIEYFERTLALATDPLVRLRAKLDIGLTYVYVGDERGLAYLEEVEREADPVTQTSDLARAITWIGRFYHTRGRHQEALACYERGRQLVETVDAPWASADLYAFLAGVYQHMLRYSESNGWARQAIELGEKRNLLTSIAIGNEYLAENGFSTGHFQDAIRYAAEDYRIGAQTGALIRMGWSQYAAAYAHFGLGDLAEAAQTAARSLDMADSSGEKRLEILAVSLLSSIEMLRGNQAEAEALLQRALPLAEESDQVYMRCVAHSSYAYFYILQGDWPAAARFADSSMAIAEGTEHLVAKLFYGAYHAEAHWGAGNLEKAAQIAADTLALAQFAQASHPEAITRRVQGQIWTAQQRWAEAEEAFAAAIAIHQASEAKLELAWDYYYRGALYHATGRLEASRMDVGRALPLLAQCGAQPPQA
jgi:tetratricopeptide (TPR) repeat protein/predicted Ser/Thr protein kinase